MSSQQGSPAPPGSGDPAQDRSGSAEAGSSRGDSSAPAADAAPAPASAAAAAAPASAPGQAPAAAGGQPGRSQPESPAAAGQVTLTTWTVDKRSDQALNTFLASNRPRVSHQDRPRQVRRVAEATAATGAAAVTTKRGRRGSSKNNPKSVSAAERVANNPGEGFNVVVGADAENTMSTPKICSIGGGNTIVFNSLPLQYLVFFLHVRASTARSTAA